MPSAWHDIHCGVSILVTVFPWKGVKMGVSTADVLLAYVIVFVAFFGLAVVLYKKSS